MVIVLDYSSVEKDNGELFWVCFWRGLFFSSKTRGVQRERSEYSMVSMSSCYWIMWFYEGNASDVGTSTGLLGLCLSTRSSGAHQASLHVPKLLRSAIIKLWRVSWPFTPPMFQTGIEGRAANADSCCLGHCKELSLSMSSRTPWSKGWGSPCASGNIALGKAHNMWLDIWKELKSRRKPR